MHFLVLILNIAPWYHLFRTIVEVLMVVLGEEQLELVVVVEVDADGLLRQDFKSVSAHFGRMATHHCSKNKTRSNKQSQYESFND